LIEQEASRTTDTSEQKHTGYQAFFIKEKSNIGLRTTQLAFSDQLSAKNKKGFG